MIKNLSKPFKWFFQLEAASGLVLLIAAIIALVISNSRFGNLYFDTLDQYLFVGINDFGLKLSVHHWINDLLMAIFFFFVTLEIKREFVQGELSNLKKALLPIIGAVGGMVVPALVYVFINFGNSGNIEWLGNSICYRHSFFTGNFIFTRFKSSNFFKNLFNCSCYY